MAKPRMGSKTSVGDAVRASVAKANARRKADYVTRCLAQEDFYFFTRYMFKARKKHKWVRAKHHKIVCDALMRVYRGETKRLIINIPPRYSKTEIVIVNFMAWCLGKVPDSEFIHLSYAANLALNNSVNCRGVVQSPEYKEVFPHVELSKDSSAKGDWHTTDGGVVYATGAEGTITGFGAGKMRPGFGGAILIDDPHKAGEARSEIKRNNVINQFQATVESRKNHPDTPIIVIMQRLHENDLSGWLLSGGNGEEWEHICLEALIEHPDGTKEALWPEKHSVEVLELMQEAAPQVFAGQYQQKPSTKEGNIFKPDKIEIVKAVPVGVNWCRGWDFGATEGGGDPTAGVKLGRMQDGRWCIAHVVKDQVGPGAMEEMFNNQLKEDGKTVRHRIPQDPGAAGKNHSHAMIRGAAGYSVVAKPVSGDKVTNAEPFAAQVNIGNVVMVEGEWNTAYKDELRVFPNGKHDDQVDASSQAFNELNDNTLGLIELMQKQLEERKAKAQKSG